MSVTLSEDVERARTGFSEPALFSEGGGAGRDENAPYGSENIVPGQSYETSTPMQPVDGAAITPGTVGDGALTPGAVSLDNLYLGVPAAPSGLSVARFELTHAEALEGAGHNTQVFLIQGSNDAAGPWVDLVAHNSPAATTTHTLERPVAYRYIRLYVKDPSASDNATRIYEMKVFNARVGGTNISQGKTVTVSGTANPVTEGGDKLVDGNTATKWCDNTNSLPEVGHAWAIIDLGAGGLATSSGADEKDAWIDVEWGAVADAVQYEVRYRPTADPAASYLVATTAEATIRLRALVPATGYTIEVRAVSAAGRVSAPATGTQTTANDTGAPSTPTGLTLTAGIKTAVAKWSEVAATDLSHYEVTTATDSGFTTGVRTWTGRATIMAIDITPGTTYWARVKAWDRSGNASAFSASVNTAMTSQVGTTEIANLAVTNAKIGLLAVDSAQIADLAVVTAKIADANITTAKIQDLNVTTGKIADLAVTNAKIANLDAAKITTGFLDAARIAADSITVSQLVVKDLNNMVPDPSFESTATHALFPAGWTSDNTKTGRFGTYCMKYTSTSGQKTFYKLAQDMLVTPNDKWYANIYTALLFTATARTAYHKIRLSLQFKDATGAYIAGNGQDGNGVWQGSGTSIGSASASFSSGFGSLGGAIDAVWDIPSTAFKADLVVEISSDATNGNLAVTGDQFWIDLAETRRIPSIKTGTSGERIEFDGEGLRHYNAAGQWVFALDGDGTGSYFLKSNTNSSAGTAAHYELDSSGARVYDDDLNILWQAKGNTGTGENNFAAGMWGSGYRAELTTSTTAFNDTTEHTALALNNVPLIKDRAYLVLAQYRGLASSGTAATFIVVARLYAEGVLIADVHDRYDSAALSTYSGKMFGAPYIPSTTGVYDFEIRWARVGGTNPAIAMSATATSPIRIMVIEVGR